MILLRELDQINNAAPTSKTSDKKILEIYQLVGTAFCKASIEKNEHLRAGHLNTIVFKFYQVYEMFGNEFLFEHLEYEINKYINEGLREDYKRDLKLF